MRTIILFILIIFIKVGYSQSLELWLPSGEFVKGEKINCSLNIKDIDTLNIFDESEIVFSSDNKFRYSFQIIPKKIGKQKIGPFFISYGGKYLGSNIVEINVVEPSVEMSRIKIEIPEKAKHNESVTIKLAGSLELIHNVAFKETDLIKVISHSVGSNFTFVNEKGVKSYSKSFVVNFSKKGKYIIDEKWFEQLPEESVLETVNIKVQ